MAETKYTFTKDYQAGYCADLAAAIHEITGWEIALFQDSSNFGHVTAVTPDGRFLDSTGIRTAENIRSVWDTAGEPMILPDRHALWVEDWDAHPDADDFRAALTLIESLGLADDDIRERAAEEIEYLEG